MTTRDSSRLVLVSKALARGSLLMVACLGGGLATTGCGSTTATNAEPFPEFEGVWAIDTDTSTLSCPQEMDIGTISFSLWGSTTTMAAGVLTDLVETAGSGCFFGYDVMDKVQVATIPNPDPFTGMPPRCKLGISSMDDSNIVLLPNASPPWSFSLLQPVKGMAPKAQIAGTAGATVSVPDSNGNINPLTPCIFVAQVNLHKLAQP
jgi:hypothetical protein